MQENVEIVTNHKLQFWTKIPQNKYCETEQLRNFGVSKQLSLLTSSLENAQTIISSKKILVQRLMST